MTRTCSQLPDLALRRIAVIGAGPMGASLAAIVSAHVVPTVLVVRDAARAEQIRSSEIALDGALSAHGRPSVVASIDALADVHPIDLVFIATKTNRCTRQRAVVARVR